MRKSEVDTDELYSELGKLSRADKLRAIQYLARTLEAEEADGLPLGATYEVWSPFNSAGTANDLLKLLEEAEKSSHG